MRRPALVLVLVVAVLIAGAGFAVAAFTAAKPTPQTFAAADSFRPPNEKLVAQSKTNDGGAAAGQLQLGLLLRNTGATRVSLSTVKIRYWFTADGTGAPQPQCYYALYGCQRLTLNIVRLSDPREKADHYLEVGFVDKALSAGSSAQLDQLAVVSFDGTSYDQQGDDYSFKNQASFTDNVAVTVYNGGELVWGVEPAAVPVVEAISVDYANGDLEQPANTVMKPFLSVLDVGNIPLDLSGVTVRYWFTRESESPVQAYCDYAEIGCNHIHLSVVPISGRPGADAYLEVAFDPVQVDAEDSSGPIHIRMQRSDWGPLDESNDYSYNSNQYFEPSTTVTAYLRGKLLWGAEP